MALLEIFCRWAISKAKTPPCGAASLGRGVGVFFVDAQFWQGNGLVLGTALLAVLAFCVAWRMRRAGARQDTEDNGREDHGSENTDTDEDSGLSDAEESDTGISHAPAATAANPEHEERLAKARTAFERQLSAIDLDLDAPPPEGSAERKTGASR